RGRTASCGGKRSRRGPLSRVAVLLGVGVLGCCVLTELMRVLEVQPSESSKPTPLRGDPFALTVEDSDAEGEPRYVTLGMELSAGSLSSSIRHAAIAFV